MRNYLLMLLYTHIAICVLVYVLPIHQQHRRTSLTMFQRSFPVENRVLLIERRRGYFALIIIRSY